MFILNINCHVLSKDLNITYDKLNPISFAYRMKDITQTKDAARYGLYLLSILLITLWTFIFYGIVKALLVKGENTSDNIFRILLTLMAVYLFCSLFNHKNPGELVKTEFSFLNPKSIFYGYLQKSKSIKFNDFNPINLYDNFIRIMSLFAPFLLMIYVFPLLTLVIIDLIFQTTFHDSITFDHNNLKNPISLCILSMICLVVYCIQPRWYSRNLNKTYLYGEEFLNKIKKNNNRKENQR